MTTPPYGSSEPFVPQGQPGPVAQPGHYGQGHYGQPVQPPHQQPYQAGPYGQAPYQQMTPQPYRAPGFPPAYPAGHPMAPMQYKDTTAAYLLWFFTGYFGGHHFYLGRTQRGVAYAITCVVSWILLVVIIGALGLIALFVLWVIDGVQLSEQLRRYNAHAYAVNQSMGYA